MKLQNLRKAVDLAQQDFHQAETKSVAARSSARAAKATAEKRRVEHKQARKAAKQARKLALNAESKAEDFGKILAKAQKRLAKALKKLGTGKPAQNAQKVKAGATSPKSVRPPVHVSSSKLAKARKMPAPPTPVRPATVRHVVPPPLPSVPPASQGASAAN
jgi:hypothetical protein